MSDADYVNRSAWLAPAGRPDAIDEVADQFERRVEPRSGAEAFWTADAQPSWPSRPRQLRLAS